MERGTKALTMELGKEISEVLGMSENTLKTHIKHLLSKSGYKSTLKLAVDVVNKKLVLPGF